MARQNFQWGVQGQGKAGVDYGDTAGWDDQQWSQYEQQQPQAPGNNPVAAPTSGAAPAPAAPPPQSAGQALTQPATVGAQPAQGAPTNVAGAFQQALLNALAPGQVSAQSPEIAGSLAANRLSEQRGQERGQRELAAMAAQGGFDSSGAFDAQRIGLGENRAARESAFAGQQVQELARQKVQQQLAAMGIGGQMLGQQDQLAQQRQLADLDAQLRREGLSLQGLLGGRELDIRDRLGSGQLNLGLLQLLSGNEQFGQNLGATIGMFNANQNRQSLLDFINSL